MTDSTRTKNPIGEAGDRRRATQPALHENLMEAVCQTAYVRQTDALSGMAANSQRLFYGPKF